MNKEELWKYIVKAHLATKKLIIVSEESAVDLRGFMQPTNEIKSAFDHIMRVRGYELGMAEAQEEENYDIVNLEKAFGHIFRAFFDAADYISIELRQKILTCLEPYSREVISCAIPEYYSEFRPKVEEINEEIAKYREKKDIGKIKESAILIDNYSTKAIELSNIYKKINKRMSSIIDVNRKERKAIFKKYIINFIIGIIVGIIVTILSCFLIQKSTPDQTNKEIRPSSESEHINEITP